MPEFTSPTLALLIVAVLGYLLGSIPFGVLITRAMGLGDLRQIGSGNIGATNVLRTGNKGAAAATLLLDAAKGGVAVLIARALVGRGCGTGRRPVRVPRPSLSRSGWVSGRQGRGDLPRHAARPCVARGPGRLRHLGGDCRDHPHLVALRPCRGGARRRSGCCSSATGAWSCLPSSWRRWCSCAIPPTSPASAPAPNPGSARRPPDLKGRRP